MNPHLRAFKRIFAHACHRADVSMNMVFNTYGLNDFLEQVIGENDGPREIAAKALVHFCTEDGKFNNFLAALKACIEFLDEEMGQPTGQARRQSLEDLQELVNKTCTYESFHRWAVSHYP